MTREEARKYIIRHCNPDYPKASRTQWDAAINLAISALEQPEIIRCGECKHNNDCNIQYAAQGGELFYCGAAERREE